MPITAKYKHKYIDLEPILNNSYFDADKVLDSMKKVKMSMINIKNFKSKNNLVRFRKTDQVIFISLFQVSPPVPCTAKGSGTRTPRRTIWPRTT
ncbi:DUF7724 family protein [Faecalicatena fissicatena]